MADLAYYAAKIAECQRLREGSDDQLSRDVYQAMADEFAAKYAILARLVAEQAAIVAPPSPLLGRVPPKRPPESAAAGPADAAQRRASGPATAVGGQRVERRR